jgi:ribosomal protein S18 acetylase RimI-like enzyme/quercetin dioxygenase-like cupin family protein
VSTPSHPATPAVAPKAIVRVAQSHDAPAIAALAERIFVRTFGPDNTPENMSAYVASAFGEDIQRREIETPDNRYLLVDIDGALGAFALLRRGATDPAVDGAAPVQVERLYVDHDYHGRGIAHQLMDACIEHARAMGGETLWLGVWERNPRAIRFYEKCGFTDVGSQTFVLGDDPQTDRVMKRALTSGGPPAKVNLAAAFATIHEHWQPHIAGALNGQHVKLVKFQGEFVWHQHEQEDELFLVHRGRFAMEFRDRTVMLEAGDFLIVPRGVEHRPVAAEEVEVLLFEPAGTLNTGNVRNERTVERPKTL